MSFPSARDAPELLFDFLQVTKACVKGKGFGGPDAVAIET
jgi:hypothetical protein